MDLKAYFEDIKGTGILATADQEGVVDAAIFARPHVLEKDQVAFIMGEKLTHHNLLSNPNACYLFMENDSSQGKRLYLTRIREEKNSELLFSLKRRSYTMEQEKDYYLVIFQVNEIRPLVGN